MEAQIFNFSTWIDETSPRKLEREFERMLRTSGFSIIGFVNHHYTPYGYSAVWLVAESHFAVHSFPEEKTTYIELSSCNERMFKRFKSIIEEMYGPVPDEIKKEDGKT